MSKLLRECKNEIYKGDYTIANKLKLIANKFLHSNEVSAQEACYILLGQKLSECSRRIIFINTNLPENRTRILKSKDHLKELPIDSKNIFEQDLLTQYCLRPNELKDCCLARFASEYETSYTKKIKEFEDDNDDNENNNNNTNDQSDSNEILQLKDKSRYIHKLKKFKIVRFPHVDFDIDEQNFYREQLMLFLPWNDENSKINYQVEYEKNIDTINKNKKPFFFYDDINIEKIEDQIRQNSIDINEIEIETNEQDEFSHLQTTDKNSDPLILDKQSYNITYPLSNKKEELVEKFIFPNLMNTNELIQQFLSLNDEQYKITFEILHRFKTNQLPFYLYIGGQAGVGKSFLIKVLFNLLLSYFIHLKTSMSLNLEDNQILLLAPTGKAAFTIRGMTIHTALSIPTNVKHGTIMNNLGDNTVNKLRSQLKNLKLIIIDEISMVGSPILARIDLRLKQFFNTDKEFGNIPFLVLGDLRQLPPVKMPMVFLPDNTVPMSILSGNYIESFILLFD